MKTLNYQAQCIICGKDASEQPVSDDASGGIRLIRRHYTGDNLLIASFRYEDKWRNQVRDRVQDKDLVSVGARYHKACFPQFFMPPPQTKRRILCVGEGDATSYYLEGSQDEEDIFNDMFEDVLIDSDSHNYVLNLENHSESNQPSTSEEPSIEFNLQTDCLFCGEDASDRFIEKQAKCPPHKRTHVILMKKQSTVDKLRNVVSNCDALWSRQVRARVKDKDLNPSDLRYHKTCLSIFIENISKYLASKTGQTKYVTADQALQDWHDVVDDENINQDRKHISEDRLDTNKDHGDTNEDWLGRFQDGRDRTEDRRGTTQDDYDTEDELVTLDYHSDVELSEMKHNVVVKMEESKKLYKNLTKGKRKRRLLEKKEDCLDDELELRKSQGSQMKTRRKLKDRNESRWSRLVCNACLSGHRTLYRLVQYTHIFDSICGERKRKRTYICWECLGVLRKIKDFKDKADKAQETLKEILHLEETKLPANLSTLAETKMCNVDYYGHTDTHAASFPRIEIEGYGKRHTIDESKHTIKNQIFVTESFDNPETSNGIPNTDEEWFDNHSEADQKDCKVENDTVTGSRRKTRKRPVKHKNTDNESNNSDSDFVTVTRKHKKDCTFENISKGTEKKKLIPKRSPAKRCMITYEKSNVILVVRKVRIQSKDADVWMKRERNSEFFRNLKNKCELCVSRLLPNESLQQHLEALHKKTPTSRACPICKIVFKSLEKLQSHVEHHNFVLRCGLCGYLCYGKQNMFDHLGRHRRTIECLECGDKFQFAKDFDAHYKLNHSLFKCDKCTKKFSTKERLLRHIDKNHTSKSCAECNKTFVNSIKLTAHMKYKHEVDRSEENYCVACGVQYNNRSQFKYHLYTSLNHAAERNKPPRPKVRVKCEVCAGTFCSRDAMLRHHKKFHLRMKGYCCPLCDKDFRANNVLRDHIKYVHEGVPRPRPHICHICARAFNVKKTLLHHVLTHTGEKPHQCPQCDARFAQRSAMRTHVRNRHR